MIENYKTVEDLKEALMFHRIVEWTKDSITLEDGQKLVIVELEQDCCAGAGGEFKNVELDAMITDVVIEDVKKHGYNETYRTCTLKIFHNQNPVALAELDANNGNGDYYYSVAGVTLANEEYALLQSYEG